MKALKDIHTRYDIEKLVDKFYDSVKKDESLGPIFTQHLEMDWEHHLPKMVDFWEGILFSKPVYLGNPMQVHIDVDKKYPLEWSHFESWKSIFFHTIDSLYKGEKVEDAKSRVETIAKIMWSKIEASRR